MNPGEVFSLVFPLLNHYRRHIGISSCVCIRIFSRTISAAIVRTD